MGHNECTKTNTHRAMCVHNGAEQMDSVSSSRINRVFGALGPVVRTTTLRDHGVYSRDIDRLVAMGYLSRLKPGHYMLTSTMTELNEIELVALLLPQGVISLFS